mmetsp:Transcript_44175/g.122316  ORF Transcript_44175/g.122316 Transcript_44175/m.122316 type:complete len:639 (-) Transcript_44175:74-1990(-)
MTDEIRIWDSRGQEVNSEDAEKWDSWELCAAAPGFPKGLVQFLKDKERGCAFPAPTSIQSYSWPALVTGKDFIGVAKTGSGKTLAFLLPGFMWLKRNRKSTDPVDTNVGPAILALTPTRELCYQIYSDAEKFGTPVKISAACAYGGAPKWEQEQKLRESPDTLIATPGRLADFLRNRSVSLDMCRYVVLDEADRMLDMGFDPQVKEILDWCPRERQMSMFTATWAKEVRALANKYINNPVHVQVGSSDIAANKDVTQHIRIVNSDADKKAELTRVLDNCYGACLVFCNTKKKVRDLAWDLHPKAVELHGDLQQKQRDESMAKFKNGTAQVLIATDVASRGLDMRAVSVVVNYDAPNNCSEDYVHRIGRTGRAGDKGDAYTFLTWGEETKASTILGIMEAGGVVPPEELREFVKGRGRASGGASDWKSDDKWASKDGADSGDKWWEKKEEKKDEGADNWWEKKEEKKDDGDKWWEKKDSGDNWWEKKDEKDAGGDKWWEKKDDTKDDDTDNRWEKKEVKKDTFGVPGSALSLLGGDSKGDTDEDEDVGHKRSADEAFGDSAPSPSSKAARTSAENGDGDRGGDDEGDEEVAAEVQDMLLDGKAAKLTVSQLKSFLAFKGLSCSGLKKELLDRALDAVSA